MKLQIIVHLFQYFVNDTIVPCCVYASDPSFEIFQVPSLKTVIASDNVSLKSHQTVYVCRWQTKFRKQRFYMQRTTNPQRQGMQTPTATITAGGENRPDARKHHPVELTPRVIGMIVFIASFIGIHAHPQP